MSVRAAACPRCGDQIGADGPDHGIAIHRQGHTGNIVASLASILIPGIGQVAQGRPLIGLMFFLCAVVAWAIGIGWLFHIGASIEAAIWNGEQ